MDLRETYLMAEHDQANKLTYHVDELRSKVTSVFLVFAGAAGGGLAIYARGEGDSLPVYVLGPVAVLLVFVALIGALTVCVLARLRRAQLEHFRIINNIRDLCLAGDLAAWNAVELSVVTLPVPTRRSGTYFWFAQVAATVAVLIGTATYLFLIAAGVSAAFPHLLIALAPAGACYVGLDRLYLRMAKAPPAKRYDNPPRAGVP